MSTNNDTRTFQIENMHQGQWKPPFRLVSYLLHIHGSLPPHSLSLSLSLYFSPEGVGDTDSAERMGMISKINQLDPISSSLKFHKH